MTTDVRIIRRPTHSCVDGSLPVLRYDVTVNHDPVVSFDADDKPSMLRYANDSARAGDDVYVLAVQHEGM